jgi:ferredoxin
MAKYKVYVDKEKCIGCGSCVGVCEGNFELVEGKAKAKKEISDLPCIKEAVDICPTQAIIAKPVK